MGATIRPFQSFPSKSMVVMAPCC